MRPEGGLSHTLSAPLPSRRILQAMEALRDPFSRVHPMFWPVLWLSLRAFARWTRRMIEAGHGYGGLSIEITWYGWIHVCRVDLSEVGKDFRRHMMGETLEDEWSVLARASVRVEKLLSPDNPHHPRESGDPWTHGATTAPGGFSEPWVPAFAGMSAELMAVPQPGTGPPLGPAPLPQCGRGAVLSSQAVPHPRPARARAPARAPQSPVTCPKGQCISPFGQPGLAR